MKFKKNKLQAIALSVLFFGVMHSCTSRQAIADEKIKFDVVDGQEEKYQLIDSILQKGLDREALYTLISDIKPISSLSSFTYPIANTDSVAYISGRALDVSKNQKFLDEVAKIQSAMNSINIPDLKFFVIPYKGVSKNERIMQIYVARESAVNRIIRDNQTFFGQFGWVEGVNPEILVTANEFGFKYDRLRGFGYLFGYPSHAVDFYTEAEYKNEMKKEFVKRKFFQIPTYERESGYFVYAYPENYLPNAEVDSALYQRSVEVLNRYKLIRKNFELQDGSLQALKLIQSENKKKYN